MRVIHLPTSVGGNPQGLSRALVKRGIESWSLIFRQNYFGYPADQVLWKESDSMVVVELKRFRTLRDILRNYDVVHYNFGSTIFSPVVFWRPGERFIRNLRRIIYYIYLNVFQLFELELLKRRHIPVFMHYQGSDARQDDFCLRAFAVTASAHVDSDVSKRFLDRAKRSRIRRLSRYCAKIYAVNPDLLHVLPQGSEFVPYCNISLQEWKPIYSQSHSGPLRIGHAPSNRKVKGTDFVLGALKELEEDGYQFELVLVEGMSHAEARKSYESIDVLVDQLLLGWYGGLALECMALGKPTVVYIRHEDLKFVPEDMVRDLPFIEAEPETIKEVLRKVLEMPRQELVEMGRRSRRFAERWHDPDMIASTIHADYATALKALR